LALRLRFALLVNGLEVYASGCLRTRPEARLAVLGASSSAAGDELDMIVI
jgi:hypothetical protein